MATTLRTQSDVLPLDHSTYNAQLFRTSLFSDCTIYSNHRVWHLHRCILSPRCEFFWNCFQGSFEEASSSKVEMHEDDPETLERLLRWIYTLTYPSSSQNEQHEAWTNDVMLYMMADKYGMTALVEATRGALLRHAAEYAREPKRLLNSAEDFVEAIEMLWVDLPERDDVLALRNELLEVVAPVVAKHIRDVVILKELMTSVPGFAVALVESLAQQKQDSRRSSSSSSNISVCSGRSDIISAGNSPRYVKPYIPLNEDSEDEME